MLSAEQVKQLITENELLQVQLQDLNDVLFEREQELLLWKENNNKTSNLQSRLDIQLDELHSMQNLIGLKQQQAEGAKDRELEMYEELTESAELLKQYNELLQEHIYLQTQLTDLKLQVEDLKAVNQWLQKIADKIGELESQLANTVIERNELKKALEYYKDPQEK